MTAVRSPGRSVIKALIASRSALLIDETDFDEGLLISIPEQYYFSIRFPVNRLLYKTMNNYDFYNCSKENDLLGQTSP
jgi:hypothetical protein